MLRSGAWHYDWSTKGLAPAYLYRIGVRLDDGTTHYVTVGVRSPGSAAGHPATAATDLIDHGLLALTDPFGVKPHEAALLGRIRGRLRHCHQPLPEGRGLLGRGLGGDDGTHSVQFVDHQLARRPPRACRLVALERVLMLLHSGLELERHLGQQLLAAGRVVAVRTDAIVSLVASIGPPGSASEIAMPATIGARMTRVHSSSVKSFLVVTYASFRRRQCWLLSP